MAPKKDIEWLTVRADLATQLYLVQILKTLNLSLRGRALFGRFDPKNGTPLDLKAEIESHTFLVEDEFLDGLERRIRLMAELLEKNVHCCTAD